MLVLLELLEEGGMYVRRDGASKREREKGSSVVQDRSLIPLPSLPLPFPLRSLSQADHVREEVGVGVTVPGAVVCKLMRGSKATAPLTQVRLTDTSLLRSAGKGSSRAECRLRVLSPVYCLCDMSYQNICVFHVFCLSNKIKRLKLFHVLCLCFCRVVVPLRGPRRVSGGEEGGEDSGAYVVTSDIQKVVTRQGQVRTTDLSPVEHTQAHTQRTNTHMYRLFYG